MFYTNIGVFSITNSGPTNNSIELTSIARTETSKPISSCNMSLLTANSIVYIFNILSNYVSENLYITVDTSTL